MKNLVQRTITGILFVAAIAGCILGGPLPFTILFACITALAVGEFAALTNRSGEAHVSRLLAMAGGAFLFLAFAGYCTELCDARGFLPCVLIGMYLIVRELYLKHEHPARNGAYAMMSLACIALPLSLLNVLAFYGYAEYDPVLPLAVFVFIWANDTGAYCAGVAFGRHRLFGRISPKKSWEGSFGGALLAVAAAVVAACCYPFLSAAEWIGFALTVVVAGTFGDLSESLFKRQLGIKDSGTVLPGHGGWLDRFDSALAAIPAAIAYLYLINVL